VSGVQNGLPRVECDSQIRMKKNGWLWNYFLKHFEFKDFVRVAGILEEAVEHDLERKMLLSLKIGMADFKITSNASRTLFRNI